MGGFVQALTENHVRVLKYLYGQPKQMARLDDMVRGLAFRNRGHVHNALHSLIGKGYVRLVSRGLYELASRGRRYVEEINA
jgi:DNA-binding IclR family transcriptional regulator